jgi:hypothetical protein
MLQYLEQHYLRETEIYCAVNKERMLLYFPKTEVILGISVLRNPVITAFSDLCWSLL